MGQRCIEVHGFIRRGGFTLVELMAIVAFVGILAAIAALSFSELVANHRFKGAATELDAVLTKVGMLGGAYPSHQEQDVKGRRAGAK
jgi:type II secretory pathway component PulJ